MNTSSSALNRQKEKIMNKTAADKKNLIFYPLGTVGRDMVYALISSYLLTFVLFTRSLTKAQLGAITAIMVFARVFDALNDPIMGNIIESTRTKWGKFKPWLIAGCITTGGVIITLFNSKLNGWPFIWLFGAMYLLFSITYTMSDISYWGMVPALSSNADMRNQLTSRATLFAGIGSTAVSVFLPLLTAGTYCIGGDARTAYGVIAIGIAVLTPLFALFTFFGVKETRNLNKQPKTKVSLKKIVSTIGGNDQLLWITIIFLIQQIGNSIVFGGLGSTYIYFSYGYEGGKYSTFTIVGMMATAVLMVFYPVISRHIKRKKLMGIMMIISSVGYGMMFGSGLVMKGDISFWILVIGYMLGNFGSYSYYLIMMISIMNTVEYNELKKGTRDEGIITSIRPFITKMASAVVVIVTAGVYAMLGVTDYTNQISDLENAANAGTITDAEKISQIADVLKNVTSGETNGLLVWITIVPFIFMLASYFLYKKKYTLDEDVYEDICRQLEAKK